MFFGTTPEFEMAIITLLYFVNVKMYKNGHEKVEWKYTFKLGNEIQTLLVVTGDDTLITAYPLLTNSQQY